MEKFVSISQVPQLTKLIGICGLAFSGKDASADFLVKQFGFRKQAFADPLRDALTTMLELGPVDFSDKKEIDLLLVGRSPRYLMQTLGTEWGRDLVHPDIWVKIASARMLQAGGDLTVFSDVRFENEAAWIRGRGGRVIFLERPSAPATRKHVSELMAEVCAGDFTIKNNASIDELYRSLNRIMDAVGIVPASNNEGATC